MATITNPGVPVSLSNGRTLWCQATTVSNWEKLDAWGREYYSDPMFTTLSPDGIPRLQNWAGMRLIAELSTGEDLSDLTKLSDLMALFGGWLKANELDQASTASPKKGVAAKSSKTTTQPKS